MKLKRKISDEGKKPSLDFYDSRRYFSIEEHALAVEHVSEVYSTSYDDHIVRYISQGYYTIPCDIEEL